MKSEQEQDLRSDVRAWLADSAPLAEALANTLKIVSYPGSLRQNDVIDIIDIIIGRHDNVTQDRWKPDWESVECLTAPIDSQILWTPLVERDKNYADVLPELEVTVFALKRGEGPTLMLNGHVDVVPVDRQDWTRAPFEPVITDGKMIARGAMDMKAGLVAAAYAFRFLAEHWQGKGTILFAVVPEEETGGNGTLAALAKGYRPDAVVFTEPTDLQVVHRHVGIQAFDIDVTGIAGGMLRRSWGASAAPVLARAALALEELEHSRTTRAFDRGGYSSDDLPGFINFVMSAGDWVATRAAAGHIEGLMGILPGETQQEAENELRHTIGKNTASDVLKIEVTIRPGGHRGGELPGGHHLVQSFSLSSEPSNALMPGSPTTSGTMVCDAKIVQGGGWSPAIVLGPIGGNLHAADEWVDLASISTLVELLVRGCTLYFDPAAANN